jgi:SAM-dependent methyltransferase
MDAERGTREPDSRAAPARIELVEEYFDRNARSWSELYRRAERANDVVLADRKRSAVDFAAAHLAPGARVLDAGCGAGPLAVELVGRGYFVHGVDVSEKMIAACRENLTAQGFGPERYDLYHGDVFAAGFPDRSFDGVMALGFLQYQDDERAALRELHRVLRPGGILFVSGPTKTRVSNWFGLAPLYRRLRWGSVLPPGHQVLDTISDHYYTPGRLRRLLGEAGFEVLGLEGHGYVNFAFIGGRLGLGGELALHRALTRAARVLPIRRFANDVMAFARRPAEPGTGPAQAKG